MKTRKLLTVDWQVSYSSTKEKVTPYIVTYELHDGVKMTFEVTGAEAAGLSDLIIDYCERIRERKMQVVLPRTMEALTALPPPPPAAMGQMQAKEVSFVEDPTDTDPL